jgi:hypothetical protein
VDLPAELHGRRVPRFDTVRSVCVDWAIENQVKYNLPESSLQTLRGCADDRAGRAFVRNTLQAIALRVDADSELARWYLSLNDYRLCKLFGSF